MDQTPLLRIWGTFRIMWPSRDNMWDPSGGVHRNPNTNHHDCVIQLHGHDHGDSDVDITRQHWHHGLTGLSTSDMTIDLRTAARHFPPRLDKFCHELSWKPCKTTIYHEVDSKTWIPVMLLLFNEARPSHRTIFFAPELGLLREKVSHYLNKFHRKDSALEADMYPNYMTIQSNIATAIVRGRRKRAARRHAGGHDQSSVAQEEVGAKAMTYPQPSADAKLRGRLRRQRKRHQLPNIGKEIYSTRGKDSILSTTLPLRLSKFVSTEPMTTELLNRLPQSLRHLPIMTLSRLGESFVAIPVCRDGHTMEGFVVVPKPKSDAYYEYGVEIEKMSLASKAPSMNQTPSTYWHKFPISVNSLLRRDDRTSETPTLATSLRWSYGCSLLLSPDHTLGPFADETEYSEQFFLPSSAENSYVETISDETNETLGFFSDIRDQWHERESGCSHIHLDAAGSHNDRKNSAAGVSHPDISRIDLNFERSSEETVQTPTSPMCHLESMRSKEYPPDLTGPSAPREQQLQNSSNESSSNYSREYLKYNLFYAGNYLAMIPLCDQEDCVQTLKRLAFSVDQHSDIRAQAVFQYALCLLAGFGDAEDRELGLSWFWTASVSGNRFARATVQRLFIAYGRKIPESGFNSRWLAEETINGSKWASEQFKTTNPHHHAAAVFDSELKKLQAASPFIKNLSVNKLDRLMCQLKPEDPGNSPRSVFINGTEASECDPRFYKELLNWACLYAKVEAFSHFFDFWIALSTETKIRWTNPWRELNDCLHIALQAGRADIAHVIMNHRLAQRKRLEDAPMNYLFFLLDIKDSRVDGIVQEITSLGGDPNEPVGLKRILLPGNAKTKYPFRNYGHPREQQLKLMPNGLSITPLRWAIMNHKASAVKALLSVGATFPTVPSVEIYTRLRFEAFAPKLCQIAILGTACYDLEIIQLFLDRHGHQGAQTVFAETPLGAIVTEFDDARRRIRLGKLATREYLFPVLAKLRAYQSQADPELFRSAAMNGHLEVVEYLVEEAGVDIECRCSGLTPLHTATLYGRKAIFTYLLDNGADASAVTTRKGISLAHLIFWKSKPAPLELYMLDKLAQAGADVMGSSSPFGTKVSPLHLAVLGSRVEAVARLLELGASRSETMNEEVMPFVIGAHFSRWGIERDKRAEKRPHYMKKLLKENPVEPIPLCGYTPIGLALRRWDIHDPDNLLRLLKLLCSESHDLKDFYTKPETKETVLHTLACCPFLCRTGIWEYALQQGSASGLHIDLPDAHGDTPLHWAQVMRGSTDGIIIDHLVALGADQSIRNLYNMTPKDIRFWVSGQSINYEGHHYKQPIRLMMLRKHAQRMLLFDASPTRGMVHHVEGSVHDDVFSRFWSTLCNGVTCNRAWDFQDCKWQEFDDEYSLRMFTHAHDKDDFGPSMRCSKVSIYKLKTAEDWLRATSLRLATGA